MSCDISFSMSELMAYPLVSPKCFLVIPTSLCPAVHKVFVTTPRVSGEEELLLQKTEVEGNSWVTQRLISGSTHPALNCPRLHNGWRWVGPADLPKPRETFRARNGGLALLLGRG